jgi:hypothetical protein
MDALTMSKTQANALVTAAHLLAEGLQRFEELSDELSRLSINSEKTLLRARQGLEACAQQEAKLAEHLRGFAQAMQDTQATQQRCLELATAAAQRVQQRQAQRTELQQRIGQLGQNAREVSAPVAALPERPDALPQDMLAPLQEVERRLDAVISEAGEARAWAERDDWADLERETQALQQQLQGLRNKVLLCRRKLAQGASS